MEKLKSLLGMSEYEGKIYQVLLENPGIIASKIAEKTRIPQNKVYQVTKGLIKEGLIIASPTVPVIYRPVDPEVALGEKTKELNELIKVLKGKFSKAEKREDERSSVWVIETKRKIKNVGLELAKKTKKRALVFLGKMPSKRDVEDIMNMTGKIDLRIIITRPDKRIIKEADHLKKLGIKIKFLPSIKFPLKFDVFDDEYVLLMTQLQQKFPERMKAILVKSKDVTSFFSERFEEMWKKGKSNRFL